MMISGHKTESVFNRYNITDDPDLEDSYCATPVALAAFRGMARSSSKGEFQGSSRPSPKAGLDNGPPVMARLECL